MSCSMGMIQVAGFSYRIDRAGNEYDIVRLLDDVTIGSFRDTARTAIARAPDVDEPSVRTIASAAIRQAKTLWKPTRPTKLDRLRRLNEMAQQVALFAGFSGMRSGLR